MYSASGNNGDPDRSRATGSRWSRILVNALSGYVSKTTDLIVSLLLIPFMVAHLGNPDYGLWILVGSVVAYGSLLDFGIASALTKYVSEYRALGRPEECRKLIASSLWLYCTIGAGIILLAAVSAPWFPRFFQLEESQHQTARWLVALSGTGIGLSIPFAASLAVLNGLQRFDITSLLGTSRFLLFAAGTVWVLLSGGGVLEIAMVQIFSMGVIQIPAIWWVRRLAPEYQFGFKGASLESLKKLASFSWSLFFVSVGGRLQSQTDEIVIGTRLPVGVVTPYSLALKLSRIPQMLAEQFIKLILPIASELHAGNDQEKLSKAFLVSTRLTLAVFLSFGVILAILAAPILELWVGASYAEYAALLWVLVAAVMFDTIQWPAVQVLQGMNRHRIFAVTSIAAGVANVALSIALIPHFGLMGVALGTLIPAAIEFSLVILPYAFRVIKVAPGRFVRESIVPAVLPSVPMAFLLYQAYVRIEDWSFMVLLVSGVLAVGLYGLIYLALPGNSLERSIVFESAVFLKDFVLRKSRSG